MSLTPGAFVEFDGLPAVVVAIPGQGDVPNDHVALWFGTPQVERISAGGAGGARPEVWIVPATYCEEGPAPDWNH